MSVGTASPRVLGEVWVAAPAVCRQHSSPGTQRSSQHQQQTVAREFHENPQKERKLLKPDRKLTLNLTREWSGFRESEVLSSSPDAQRQMTYGSTYLLASQQSSCQPHACFVTCQKNNKHSSPKAVLIK